MASKTLTIALAITFVMACGANEYQKMTFNNGNFNVSWMYDMVTDNLKFRLEVKTTGWVGFGFALKAPNSMLNYDVAVGGVTDAGQSYLNDYYTEDLARPPLDANQDYTLTNASESNGWTRISFERKPDTGDAKDVKISAGMKVHFIWAYKNVGEADNPSNFQAHTFKGNSPLVEVIAPMTVAPTVNNTVLSTTQPPPTTVTPTTMAYTNILTMDGGNYKAQWNYDKTNKEYMFHLKVKTTGWIAFGFAKTAPNNMQDYDVAIGGVTSGPGGQAYINDFYTGGRTRPPVDQSNDFTLVKGTESGGYTELWFTRKADTGDSGKDLPITPGTKVFIVWAYHSTTDADDTSNFPVHTKRGFTAASMVLSVGSTTQPPTTLTGGATQPPTTVTGGGSMVKHSFIAFIAILFLTVRCLF